MKIREREGAVFPIRAAVFHSMLRHVEQEKPREAVGMLAGDPSGEASLALPLTNLIDAGAFLADPYSQYLAEKRISAEELTLLAIYHSHPGGSAHLSAADREFASLRNIVNIVIAPAHGDCPLDVRAYRIRGESIIHITLHIGPVADPLQAARSTTPEPRAPYAMRSTGCVTGSPGISTSTWCRDVGAHGRVGLGLGIGTVHLAGLVLVPVLA
jgi:proteasome lid subunit RPN8/RPN11